VTAPAIDSLTGAREALGVERRLRQRQFAPVPRLTVSEWANERRMLSSEASAVPGRWTSFPYQREVMDVCHGGAYKRVVVMWPSQVGKTEILLNLIGYHLDLEPCPILIVEPDLDMAKTISRDRLDPMFRDMPVLQGKIHLSARREKDNTLLFKAGPGWRVTLVGANSPSGLAMRPVRICLFDEVDRYKSSAGSEGDPIALGEKRSATFPNRLTVICSSPGIKGESRLEMEYESSDQRKWLVPCPHCDHEQSLEWGGPDEPYGLKWETGKPDTAQYLCAGCQCLIGEEHKWQMNERGRWVATFPGRETAGFQLTALVSPVIGWRDLAKQFLAAKAAMKSGNLEMMKAFVCTSLARTWEEPGEKFDASSLLTRRETYAAEVPAGVGLLLAGVDVQKDRIEMTTWGFGAGEESWIICHQKFRGDPEKADDECWRDLERERVRDYVHESGQVVHIRALAIDFGHASPAVAEYARKKKNVFVVKGDGQNPRQPIGAPSKSKKHRVRLWLLGPDYWKGLLLTRLMRTEQGKPGYIHVPSAEKADDGFLVQFANEKVRTVHRFGRPVRTYQPITAHSAVEAIDCGYYALALLYILGDAVRSGLESLAKKLEVPVTPAEPVASPAEKPSILPLLRRPTFKPKTGWVQRY
jgi:phage terminase large subunit GpA-like protein